MSNKHHKSAIWGTVAHAAPNQMPWQNQSEHNECSNDYSMPLASHNMAVNRGDVVKQLILKPCESHNTLCNSSKVYSF